MEHVLIDTDPLTDGGHRPTVGHTVGHKVDDQRYNLFQISQNFESSTYHTVKFHGLQMGLFTKVLFLNLVLIPDV